MKKSTLFIDESGKSSLAEQENNPFILAGVILDDDEVVKIEGFFNYIKRKYTIDINTPFHSYELFEAPSTCISDDEAVKLSRTLGEFISLIPIRIKVIGMPNKIVFKNVLGIKSDDDFKGDSERKEMKEYPYRVLSAELFKWFAHYLNQNENCGQIIVDSRRGGDYHLLKNLEACKDPNGPLTQQETNLIKERCSAICFADKSFLSGGIEITDLISYISFFRVRRLISSMKNKGLPYIWKEIKLKLENQAIEEITEQQIRDFFRLKKDEVHKNLKLLRNL